MHATLAARSRLSRIQLAEVLRYHAWFLASRPGGRRAVVVDHDLNGLALTGHDLSHANLTGSTFYGSNLRGCRFDSATAFGCDFRYADMQNASLIRADLRGCNFAGAMLEGANLFEADLREGGQITRDRKGEFHGHGVADPSIGASGGAAFSGANLTNASLAGVFAVRADFSDATMRGCRLTRARVRGANFARCDLDGADFGQADTRDACFRGAVLMGVNFDLANVAGSDMEDTLSDKSHGRLLADQDLSLDDLLRKHSAFIESGGAAGALLDLSGYDLRRSKGAWANACLTMARASGAVFYGLDLTHAALQAAKCEAADFRNCRLDDADMRGVFLSGAKLNNTSMRNVDFRPLRTGRGILIPANLSNAMLRHADLRGANLAHAELQHADLSFANLEGANLADADCVGARLEGCELSEQQRTMARGGLRIDLTRGRD